MQTWKEKMAAIANDKVTRRRERKARQPTPKAPATVSVNRSDLARVVEYLYHDEKRHYEECLADSGSRSPDCRKHVFLPVRRLDRALERVCG
jgi:hypothetical protein